MDALSERQFDLLARMSALDPPVRIMGGYAEDAPLAGTSTRPHVDIDWLLPRHEQELRLGQAKKLGFQAFEVRGEPAPHQPFYLHGRDGDLELEIGIVARTTEGSGSGSDGLPSRSAASLPRRLPDQAAAQFNGTFEYPPVEIDGVAVCPASPLALSGCPPPAEGAVLPRAFR
jgi:hypothetical protein